jgi:hypothetical protein
MMPLLDSHRCTMFRDFTGERQPSQSVLLSICGYSLASDAGGKEFGTAAAGGTISGKSRHRSRNDFFYGNQQAERRTCFEIHDQSWMNDDSRHARQFP